MLKIRKNDLVHLHYLGDTLSRIYSTSKIRSSPEITSVMRPHFDSSRGKFADQKPGASFRENFAATRISADLIASVNSHDLSMTLATYIILVGVHLSKQRLDAALRANAHIDSPNF